MIANTIIASVLRKLVIIPSGGTPTVNQYADGLEALNDLIRLWSANSSFIYEDTREEITITSGTNSFTLGSTGDYVTGKPVNLLNASLKEDGHEYPLRIIDKNVFENFHDKSQTHRPYWIYFRNTYPNSTFYFDSTTDVQYTLVLTTMKELTEFSDGTTDLPLPGYYETALKANLLVYLAPEFGAAKRVTQLMYQIAEDSKSSIVGKAVKVNVSRTDIPDGYNINSGVRFNRG